MTETKVVAPYKLPTWHDWSPRALFYHPLQAGSIDGTDLVAHDRGVLRAMLSRYKPNKNVTGDDKKTLFVGRLSKDTTEDMICEIFEEFGELEKCRLVRDFVTGFSRGFAFVEFKRKRDAIAAAAETNKMNVNGREILVDFECERSLDGWKPRRLGGGFGGCKESGQLRFGGCDRPFKRPLPNDIDRFSRQTGGDSSKDEKRHETYGNRDRSYSSRDRRGQDRYHRDRGGEERRDGREQDRGRYRERDRSRERDRTRRRSKERRGERSRDRGRS